MASHGAADTPATMRILPHREVVRVDAAYSDDEHRRWVAHAAAVRAHTDLLCAAAEKGWSLLEPLIAHGVPCADTLSDRLFELSGWRLVPVQGLVDVEVFYGLLARRLFPCSLWMRPDACLGFSSRPDMLHEIMGHALLLHDPTLRALYEAFGRAYQTADTDGRVRLARLFWYVGEVGILLDGDRRRVIGAAILSSPRELEAVRTAELRPFDITEVLDTTYDPLADAPSGVYYGLTSLAPVFEALDHLGACA